MPAEYMVPMPSGISDDQGADRDLEYRGISALCCRRGCIPKKIVAPEFGELGVTGPDSFRGCHAAIVVFTTAATCVFTFICVYTHMHASARHQ